jgi:NAD(P)-dependent dehydrogenase (short-subunit alcohol dehydrogenase family)
VSRPVVLVTGGSAGIGRAAVCRFAAEGYDVAVLARGRAGVDAAVRDVVERGGRGLAVVADVSDLDAVRAAATKTEAELGPIDVWVNCAFVGSLAYFWDTSPEEYRRMTDVTYFGQVHGTRVALDLMRPRDRGTIINLSSALAHRGIPLQSAYCGSKHAVKGFTESVIAELRATKSSVHLGLVTLPGINTPQFSWNLNRMPQHPQPVPPIYQPEVAARAIVEAALHPRRDAWVGLPTVYTILGNRVAPAFMDWYLGRTGVSGQQTDEAAERLGSNVFEPRDADTDRGAHGSFDDKSHDRDFVSVIGDARHAALKVPAAALGAVGKVARALRSR